MATIKRRGRSWQLNWSDESGQHRISLGRISEAQANVKLREKEIELITGRRFSTAPTYSLRAFSADYLNWYRVQYPSTYERTEGILRLHILPRFGSYPLDRITAMDAHAWVAERLDAKAEIETVARELRTFKAVFSRAVAWEYIDRHPLKGVQAPRSLNDAPPLFYSLDQLDELYRHSPYHHWMWRFYVNTGIRASEGLNLRIDQCDGDVVSVVSTSTAANKTRKWRPIPLNDHAKWARDELAKRSDSEFLMPQINQKSLSRAFANCVKRAGLPGSHKTMRHTFASHLVSNAVPIRTVQKLLGHASVKTTEIYAHLAPGHLDDSVTRIQL